VKHLKGIWEETFGAASGTEKLERHKNLIGFVGILGVRKKVYFGWREVVLRGEEEKGTGVTRGIILN